MTTAPLPADVQRDWRWSDLFMPEIQRVLKLNAAHFLSTQIATAEQDMKQATDIVVKVSGSRAIAVRLRRDNYLYRDLTLRAYRVSGAMTEIEKIRSGYGDYYLYGWTSGRLITEWMLVSLHSLRTSGLLNRQWSVIGNRDQATAFIAIPYRILAGCNCVVSAQIRQR